MLLRSFMVRQIDAIINKKFKSCLQEDKKIGKNVLWFFRKFYILFFTGLAHFCVDLTLMKLDFNEE